jgi:hypothetical protein
MESAGKTTEKRGIIKPTPKSVLNNILENEVSAVSSHPLAGQAIDRLPSGPGTSAMRQQAVLQMQRTHGNAHVMRQLDPSIQRQEDEAAAAASGGQSKISGGGGSVDTGGSGVEVTSGNVQVHSPMVSVDGVLRTNTIIAENVVGTNYTPGVGNLW